MGQLGCRRARLGLSRLRNGRGKTGGRRPVATPRRRRKGAAWACRDSAMAAVGVSRVFAGKSLSR